MILYNVTVNIDRAAQEEWVRWMKEEHIPEVLATGLFLEHKMSRVLAEEEGGATYAIQYLCADMPTYETYRDRHAPALQAKTQARFGGRFVAFRTLLHVVHHS